MTELLYKEEVFRIVGCGIEVHRHLGSGFLEPVYQEAMELELSEQGIAFQSQVLLQIQYKKHTLSKEYKSDLICLDKIVVELKALDRLSGEEEAQVLNYLKATGLRVGLVLNFGSYGKLEWKRFVM